MLTVSRHFTVFNDVTHYDEVLAEVVGIVFVEHCLFARWMHYWGYEAGDRG